jgi:hypothetical protein
MTDPSTVEHFFLVYVSEPGEDLKFKSFESLNSLATFVKTLSTSSQGYMFAGSRINITAGPWRYLVHGTAQVQLFDTPSPGKLDRGASLGQKQADDVLSPDYAAVIRNMEKDEPEPVSTDPPALMVVSADEEELPTE